MKPNVTAYIDKVNIGLMLLTLIPAVLLPFELFLFVYAILGPLHYLTEINWLHKKQYFTKYKYDYLIITLFIIGIAVLLFLRSPFRYTTPILIFTVFGTSLSMILFKSMKKKLICAGISLIIGSVLYYFFKEHFKMLFSILLPTIIHVFIFTGTFILLGALKSNSKLGLYSFITFICCSLIVVLVPAGFNFSTVSEYIYNNYSGFRNVNRILMRAFSFIHTESIKDNLTSVTFVKDYDIPVFFSESGIKIMRFIAFAYTYHYLNWFSKTSVIQWHRIRKVNLFFILAIWVSSVVLYIYNYKIGLKWLYVLSFGHVLLEFPLNFKSFIDVKKQLSLKLFNNK